MGGLIETAISSDRSGSFKKDAVAAGEGSSPTN
jgi:hypothetical protein